MTTDVETDPFAAPTEKAQEPTSQAGDFVPLSAMVGRLILIVPVEFERSVLSTFKSKDGKDQYGPKLVANIAVLSGESEFNWTDKDDKDQELTVDEIPALFPGTWIQSAPLVDATEDARRTDLSNTMTVGVLLKPKAYKLKAPNAGQIDKARAWLKTDAGQAFKAEAQKLHDERVKSASEAPATANPFSS